MRAAAIMPGQRYATPDGVVRIVEVDTRGGAVRAADGRTWPCRAIHPTAPQRPGSRAMSDPRRLTCRYCEAAPGDPCRTRSGAITTDHAERWQWGRVGTDITRTIHPHQPTTWSARHLGATV